MKDLYASFKKSRWFPLAAGVLFIVLGLFCLFNPAAKMEQIALFIGVGFLIYALFQVAAGVMTKENQKLRILHVRTGEAGERFMLPASFFRTNSRLTALRSFPAVSAAAVSDSVL